MRKSTAFLNGLVAATLLTAAAAPALADVVVSPGSMNGWAFYTTDGSGVVGTGTGTGDLVTGPATPPVGTGSAHLQTAPGQGDGSVQLRTDNFAGIKLADVTQLSYSTYATSWNGAQLPYLTIWIDYTGDGIRDDRLWFEPEYSRAGYGNPSPQAAPALNTWQTWDALDGNWYSDNEGGPGTDSFLLSTYLASHPNAKIITDAGQGIGGFRIATGFASAGDNYNTYVDNVTLATSTGSVTYNFEAAAPVPLPAAAWGGLALLGGLAIARRRKPAVMPA